MTSVSLPSQGRGQESFGYQSLCNIPIHYLPSTEVPRTTDDQGYHGTTLNLLPRERST